MISRIETINRFLASIKALETETGAYDLDTEEYYKTHYLYPIRDSFDSVKDFCNEVGFIGIRRNKLSLAKNGRHYLNLGKKKEGNFLLEPNTQQISYLNEKIFLVAPMLDLVKKILYHFYRGANRGLYLPKEEVSGVEDQNLLSLLLQLSILKSDGNYIVLAERYTKYFESLVLKVSRVITPEELEKMEEERKTISKIAEKYVLQYEHERLKRVDAQKQSSSIVYMATKNIAAGYDILSFNNKNSKAQDRFIEVKAGKADQINFFLSRHEFETAKKLKDKYWIYYVVMQNKEPQKIKFFNDPINSIIKNSEFNINTEVYEVSEK